MVMNRATGGLILRDDLAYCLMMNPPHTGLLLMMNDNARSMALFFRPFRDR